MARIIVGNVPSTANEATIRDLFALHGAVESVSLIQDLNTGRPRGFGFVVMPELDAARAVLGLNGTLVDGAVISVGAADEPDHTKVVEIAQWRGR